MLALGKGRVVVVLVFALRTSPKLEAEAAITRSSVVSEFKGLAVVSASSVGEVLSEILLDNIGSVVMAVVGLDEAVCTGEVITSLSVVMSRDKLTDSVVLSVSFN